MKLIRSRYIGIAILAIIIGGLIYLLFRSEQHVLVRMTLNSFLGNVLASVRTQTLTWVISDWIIFSLPDGLWLLSYILTMKFIWKDNFNEVGFIFISIMPISALLLEFLQIIHICPGTFDFLDIVAYVLPTLLIIPNIIHYERKTV